MTAKVEDVAGYIQRLPHEVRTIAEDVRQTILQAVAGSSETVKYGMPGFTRGNRCFIYFAVWKKHVGLYPIYPQEPDLEVEIAPFRAKKDTVQFDLKRPIPLDLIARLARAQDARSAEPVRDRVERHGGSSKP